MLRVVFSSNGGRCFGIYLSLEVMRSTLSFIETQLIKAREKQQKQQPQLSQHMQRHTQQQQQSDYLDDAAMKQRCAGDNVGQLLDLNHPPIMEPTSSAQSSGYDDYQQQNQRKDGAHLLNGTYNGLVGNNTLMRQNPGTANSLATKMYVETLKRPHQSDSLDNAATKQRYVVDNVGHLLDLNHPPILTPTSSDHSLGYSLDDASMKKDIKMEMNLEGSLVGIPGSNQGDTFLDTGKAYYCQKA